MLHDLANDDGQVALKRAADTEGWRHNVKNLLCRLSPSHFTFVLVYKGKGMVLDIAPLNDAPQLVLYNLGSGSRLALAIVLWLKLAAPIACATDFGPAVMQPDVLCPSQPR